MRSIRLAASGRLFRIIRAKDQPKFHFEVKSLGRQHTGRDKREAPNGKGDFLVGELDQSALSLFLIVTVVVSMFVWRCCEIKADD